MSLQSGGIEGARVGGRGGAILTCGFGMTFGAWIAAYLCRVPLIGPLSGQATIFLMLAMVFVGGIFAGRYSGRVTAVVAGMVSGLLNILVLGSVFHDLFGAGGGGMAGLWVGGSIVLNGAVAGAGGLIGGMVPAERRGDFRWAGAFALVLTAATLALIMAGGLVTAFGAGMAVPDWPQSFGYNMFLFPLSKMQSVDGKFYEHSHRLLGSLVGLTSLTVAIYFSVVMRGKWVKAAVWGIFLGVCVQGLMGGLRVTENSVALATVHGIFAQVVLAGMACVAAVSWEGGSVLRTEAPLRDEHFGGTDRIFSGALLAAMVVQLTLGALVRHRVDVAVLMHIVMAALVALLALACGFRAWAMHKDVRALSRTGLAVMCVVLMQLALGILALVMRPVTAGEPQTAVSALWTTAHQANGAILLALCAVLHMWNCRLVPTIEVTTSAKGEVCMSPGR